MKILAVVLLLALPASCIGPKGMVKASELKPLAQDIRTYHDAKVLADESLSESQKADRLGSTKIMAQVLDEASK